MQVNIFIGKRKLPIFFILFILLLFHGLNNYIILTKSRYCLGPDSVEYFKQTIYFSQILKKVKFNLGLLYPRSLFCITASPFLLFGTGKNTVIMSNLIYFAILLFATYGIGKKLYDYRVGILSAFLVSMFPTVFALSRVLMVDFALAAMVTATLYLFTVNRFDSLMFSLLTGITIGLGSLAKQSYFIFLLPILIYPFLQKDNLKSKKIIRNFIFAVILGLVITAIYYVRLKYDYYHVTFQIKNNITPFFYLYSLLNRQLLLVFFLFFLAGLVFHLKEKKYFIPLMICILLLPFSVSPNKEDRFILPILPYIAVIISGFIWSLSKTRRFFIISLVLFSFLQYFTICYGIGSPFLKIFLQKFSLGPHKEMISEKGLFSIIDEGDWENSGEEIIKIINDLIEKNKMNRKVTILFLGQSWQIHTTIDYSLIIKKLSVESRRADIDSDFLFRRWAVDKNFNNQILQSDIIIVEKISPEDMWIHTGYLSKVLEQNFDKFEFIRTVEFPHNLLCYIYKNKEMI